MFPLAGYLLRVALHKAISLLRSYQLGKSIGATNIHMPVIHTKLSDFIQTTKFRKYPILSTYSSTENINCVAQDQLVKRSQHQIPDFVFVIKAHRVALRLLTIGAMGLLKAIKALAHPSKAYYNHVMCYTIRDYSVYAHTQRP